MADPWLPPLAFLPPGTQAPAPSGWTPWFSSQGTPHRPWHSSTAGLGQPSWGPQQVLDDWTAAQAANQVYASMTDLAAALHARLATLTAMPEFHSWLRSNPDFKPRLSGVLMTALGPRPITVLLDTGATHCFICARLAAALSLRTSGQPGPTSVTTAATGGTLVLAAPVLIHLGLGDRFRESLSVSPMDMDVGDDLILGWDWISSHDLRHLYADGQVSLRSGPALLQLALLPASARPAARTLSVIGHGEFRRLLRHIERAEPETPKVLPVATATSPPPPLRRSTGWSRPVHADHAELAAIEAATLLAARTAAARASRRNLTTSAASPTAWRCSLTVRCSILRPFAWQMRSSDSRVPTTRRSLRSRRNTPTCWAGPPQACHRTAAWSSSSRPAARRCHGHVR